jgi:propanediol dehydratase small subunit
MKKIILASMAALFFMCVPYTTNITLLNDVPLEPVKADWESYGAYYEIDDLFIETAYRWSPVMEGPQTKYVVSKRVRILSDLGTKYASVAVPYYAPLSRLVLSMKDASGKPVSLNTVKIKEEYQRTGVIVFPKATAGCVLDVSAVFTAASSITSFEFAFWEAIPVLKSDFTFSYQGDKYAYEFKTYGDKCESRIDNAPKAAMGKFIQRTWGRRDLLPPPRIAYLKNIYETASRVSLVMRSYSIGQAFASDKEVFTSWNKLSESYNKYLFATSAFQSSQKLRKKVRDLTRDLGSDSGKADAVLCWVQDSLSVSDNDSKNINPDRVIEKREGTIWEITYVLREMLDEINCFSDIIVTRGRHRGGFDSSFVTPITLSLPIVVARCNKKKFVAYPFYRGSKLGEYPASFFDCKGLSLQNGAVEPLPQPPGRTWKCGFAYTLDVTADSISQDLTACFSDYWAYDMRTDLASEKKETVKEYFQKMLTNFGLSNALLSCTVENLDERGTPLIARLAFATPGQYIERKGKKLYKLDHLFGSYFSFYDTSRTSRFTTDMDEMISEEIVVHKRPRAMAEFHMTCNAMDNPLFRVTCEEQQNEREYRFARNLHIKKSDLSAEQVRLIYPDILRLKEIGDSYVVFK